MDMQPDEMHASGYMKVQESESAINRLGQT